jgi:hypothetical protein
MIWQHVVEPKLVHYNAYGARVSRISLDRSLPVLLRINLESRVEGLNIYKLSRSMRPIAFSREHDTLLWTRYRGAKDTFQDEARQLMKPGAFANVQRLAVLLAFWNVILSNPRYNDLYIAIRKERSLKQLVVVEDTSENTLFRKTMSLVDCTEVTIPKLKVWQRVIRRKGAEKLWSKWDMKKRLEVDKVSGSPEISFAKISLGTS